MTKAQEHLIKLAAKLPFKEGQDWRNLLDKWLSMKDFPETRSQRKALAKSGDSL